MIKKLQLFIEEQSRELDEKSQQEAFVGKLPIKSTYNQNQIKLGAPVDTYNPHFLMPPKRRIQLISPPPSPPDDWYSL